MSTHYRPLGKMHANDLFDGRLEKMDVVEKVVPEQTNERVRFITDGRNYLSVAIDGNGFVSDFTRFGANAPGKILTCAAEAFEMDIVSEHEPQYWGFGSTVEWDAWQDKLAREDQEKFY